MNHLRQVASAGNKRSNTRASGATNGTPIEPQDEHESTVLFAPAGVVRAVKVHLEASKLLDKTRSIAKVLEKTLCESFTAATTNHSSSVADAESASSAANAVMTVHLLPPFQRAALSAVEVSAACEEMLQSNKSFMAIPVTDQFAQQLRNPSSTDDKASVILQELNTLTALNTLLLGPYSTRTSKRTQVNSFQKANDFLATLAQRHGLPISSGSSAGGSRDGGTTNGAHASGAGAVSRFEIVGDVLMLPQHYLTGTAWNAILGLPADFDNTIQIGAVDSVTEQYRRNVFGTLAQCFGLQRVARKAEIDSGPKRESRVRLLHPVLGIPPATGPNAPGWVVVVENKIAYGFDITRVMFCSGNVTERMRMAHQQSQNDVVVDLYCGIGYYTVPLLLHGKAKHVHACEWNPNSVLSLRENLRCAGVNDRCTVYEGDNRVSSVQLVDIADRVLLGLLPSSVQGWSLAARALKSTGGTIHVHENVLESILTTWVEETRVKFEDLLKEHGKTLSVSVVHLEKVKSYAPRVYHVVLDLTCCNV